MLPAPLSPDAVLPFERGLAVERAEAGLPGLSLVIPIMNAGLFLERTVRSLLLNDLSGVEVIVMDGGSTDDTPAILAHYAHAFATVVSEPDEGQADAINKGFARATGAILGWLNGDDLLLPGALNRVRRLFRDEPGTEVVVGNAAITELDLTVTHQVRREGMLDFDHLIDYSQFHLVQPAVFFTRRAFEAVGPLRTDLHYAMDADLFLALARRTPFRHLPYEVAWSVYHDGCKTRAKRAESLAELALVQARHGGLAEAAATLQILVDLYNSAAAAAGHDRAADVAGQRAAGTGEATAGAAGADAGLLARRLAAALEAAERREALVLETATASRR
jgi:GT2 family glycosyltransferase